MSRPPVERASVFGTWYLLGWLTCLVLLASGEWTLGPSLFVLIVGWRTLYSRNGPPVVAAAFTHQWAQVTIALLYSFLAGRRIVDMRGLDYDMMVLIGLCSIAALFSGYYLVSRKTLARIETSTGSGSAISLRLIAFSYAAAIVSSVLIQRIAWLFSSVTQLLLIFSLARFVLLYVLTAHLMKPKPRWIAIISLIGFELALGLTGFFAVFRESLVFIALAIISSANRRRPQTWIAAFLVAAIALSAGLTWTAIKPRIRETYSDAASPFQRLVRVAAEIGPILKKSRSEWIDQSDRLVSRMWMMRYPSLVLERVPAEIPHEGGKILWGAVGNTLMPRIFFPQKGILPSESDKVRKYAGVWVAGRERSTSFAFSYPAESYVDFGWPLMLVPILAFGCLIGLADRVILAMVKTTELQSGVRVVVLWSSTYLFESSWVMMIGTAVSLFLVLLPAAILFERGFKLAITTRLGQLPDARAPGGQSTARRAIIDSRKRVD